MAYAELQDYLELNEATELDHSVPLAQEVDKNLAKMKNQESNGADKCSMDGL